MPHDDEDDARAPWRRRHRHRWRYLIEAAGRPGLADCGLFQRPKKLRERNPAPPFAPRALSCRRIRTSITADACRGCAIRDQLGFHSSAMPFGRVETTL